VERNAARHCRPSAAQRSAAQRATLMQPSRDCVVSHHWTHVAVLLCSSLPAAAAAAAAVYVVFVWRVIN